MRTRHEAITRPSDANDLEQHGLGRVKSRRANAIGGKRTTRHPHAFSGPPTQRTLPVADILLGQIETYLKRRHLVYGIGIKTGQAHGGGRVGL